MEHVSRDEIERGIVVWIARLSEAPASLAFLDPLLDAHDRERAARFRFAEDRARFVVGRALIRKSLGLYLGEEPESIQLSFTERGRPIFAADPALHFSLSHTGDIVAVALAANARVGIDFEFAKPNVDLPALAERILSADDFRKFQVLPEAQAVGAFFRVWTRKEAYFKARGEGIGAGLNHVSVSFTADETSPLTDSRDASAARAWRLHDLAAAENYFGAVACDDPARRPHCHRVQFREGEMVIEL